MGYEDMGYDDAETILGAYEDMGADDQELGRRRRRFQSAQPKRFPAPNPTARRQALKAYQPDAYGLPLDQIMPFPNGTFTAAVGTLLLQAQPQREFQPRRLVISLGRVGATATGLVQVTQFTVGADPQFVNTGAIPAEMFSPTAVGVMLKPAAARPGVTVSLELSVTPLPAAADTILVSAAAVGPAIG